MTDLKTDFVHLHVHTNYSLLESTIRLENLFNKLREHQMSAIAITDHGNLFGAIEFYQQAQKVGIKPIIGCELHVAPKSRFDKSSASIAESSHHLIILVKNMQGYKNLLKLTTAGYLEGFYYTPRVDKELLQRYSDGLVATSACLQGEVASYLLKGDREAAVGAASEYQDIFGMGNFYLEIMENGLPEQKIVNKGIMEISRLLSIPVVATNNCHYLQADDAEAYYILMCIRAGKTLGDTERKRFETSQFYLRSPREMMHLFSYCPEAISNTVLIAEKCDLNLELSDLLQPSGRLANVSAPDHFTGALAHSRVEEILSLSGANSNKEKRDVIFRYLTEKYGYDRLARIISFRKMRARSVVRYVGRAMNIPDEELEAITKIIPRNRNISLKDIINQVPRLQEAIRANKTTEKLLNLSQALEGLDIQSTVHPTGAVISDSPLINKTPLCMNSNGELVTQYNRDNLRSLGLRTFDLMI